MKIYSPFFFLPFSFPTSKTFLLVTYFSVYFSLLYLTPVFWFLFPPSLSRKFLTLETSKFLLFLREKPIGTKSETPSLQNLSPDTFCLFLEFGSKLRWYWRIETKRTVGQELEELGVGVILGRRSSLSSQNSKVESFLHERYFTCMFRAFWSPYEHKFAGIIPLLGRIIFALRKDNANSFLTLTGWCGNREPT